MKRLHFSSFRQRLNAAFLAVSLVPMLLCSGLLLQIFRLRMTSNAQQTAQQQLSASCEALDTLHSGFLQTAASLQHNPLVAQALFDAEAEDTAVYSQLFDATESVRSFARFDLYDISGRWRYSTQTAPEIRSLPTNWGLLYEAACAGTGVLVCSAAEDPADTDEPLLHAAMLLTDRYGAPVGYLTIGMLETQLRTLLGGTAGAQNELLLLDARWRPVYCTQPAQTQSLADALRRQLLSGKALTGLSADVSYTVRQHTETGLYLVLQQPQPLSAGTLRLLYSVSVLCALACIILSVVLSLQLSRQVFQPIGRLHHAIRQVGKNNLDVQVPVPAGRHDELGELAQQFNTMVVALRHNQQALLENQRALNRAQIRMLQAQLNPHFLCNTLDTMKWISKINQVPQVALMSTNLADILRFCITPDEFVPLRRELEILSRYVEIQRIRLSESFSYTEAVPEALLSCMVPKMLLQPLAENAILHGLSGVEHGELSVTAVLAEQDVLEIRVRDNGCGFPPDLLGPYKPPETQTGHLGLLNVDTILRKHYGDAFGLRLENPEGGGACILARLPAKGGPGT